MKNTRIPFRSPIILSYFKNHLFGRVLAMVPLLLLVAVPLTNTHATVVVYEETFSPNPTEIVAVDTFNWQQHATATAIDRSNNIVAVNGYYVSPNSGIDGVSGFLFGQLSNISLIWTEEFTPISRSPEISKLSIYSNNVNINNIFRFAIRIDDGGTDRWYASEQSYSSTGGTGTNFPTNGILHELNFTTSGSAWRELTFTPGTELSLAGSTIVGSLPTGPLTAAGIFTTPVNDQPMRLDNFSIAVIPEPAHVGVVVALLSFLGVVWMRRNRVKV